MLGVGLAYITNKVFRERRLSLCSLTIYIVIQEFCFSMRLRHYLTGEHIEVSRDPLSQSLYRFRCRFRGLQRYCLANGCVCWFLTLTLRDEEAAALHSSLNRFIQFLRDRFRRACLPFAYIWVADVQRKRYARYGVKALHWHFAIAAPSGSLPHVECDGWHRNFWLVQDGSVVQNDDLIREWGKGIVWCQPARDPQGLGRYLMRYLKKGFSSDWPSGLRRFGSSRLGHLGWSNSAFRAAEFLLLFNPYCVIRRVPGGVAAVAPATGVEIDFEPLYWYPTV